jgi:hypothetical protein
LSYRGSFTLLNKKLDAAEFVWALEKEEVVEEWRKMHNKELRNL